MSVEPPAKRDKHLEHYPGLVVMDGRVTGSITLGHSRLPLWCLPAHFDIGWHTGDPNSHGTTDSDLTDFAHNLFEMREDWARLVLILADEHRMAMRGTGWFGDSQRAKKRLRAALQACLDDLSTEALDRADPVTDQEPQASAPPSSQSSSASSSS